MVLVAIGELNVQEFMCRDETTQWKRDRLAHAFASMSHPSVLNFQSAAPGEGVAAVVQLFASGTRSTHLMRKLTSSGEVKLGVWLRSLVITARRVAVVERTGTVVALQDNQRATHHPVAVARQGNGGRRQSQRRDGQLQRP